MPPANRRNAAAISGRAVPTACSRADAAVDSIPRNSSSENRKIRFPARLATWSRSPAASVVTRRVLRPAAAGAIALDVLKVGTALTVGAVSDTAGGAAFGTVLATLFFLFVVSRTIIVLAAWIATDGTDGPGQPNAATNCSAEVAR